MRLSSEQQQFLRRTVEQVAGRPVTVSVFGSRTDVQARGGDIDLLVESDPPLSLRERIRVVSVIEQTLHLPLDIVATRPGTEVDEAFVKIARQSAVPLCDS